MVESSRPIDTVLLRGLRAIGLASLALGLLVAGFLATSEYRDRQVLRQIAEEVTKGLDSPGDNVSALNNWVYGNQGFAKNRHHFVLARLGPTPMQVLEYGGDCADKSRLLSAMLETIGLRSSLAMLYPCPECAPVHTVVVADLGSTKTLADPVFNITFPRPGGGYFSVDELIQDPWLLSDRLRVLRAERGPGDKIVFYREFNHRFDYLTTINWKASGLTLAVGWVVRALGGDPREVFRPMWLENPKRALTYAALVVALVGFAMVLAARRWRN